MDPDNLGKCKFMDYIPFKKRNPQSCTFPGLDA